MLNQITYQLLKLKASLCLLLLTTLPGTWQGIVSFDCSKLGPNYQCAFGSIDPVTGCSRGIILDNQPYYIVCAPKNCQTFQPGSICKCNDGTSGDNNDCVVYPNYDKKCGCTVNCELVGAKCSSGSDTACAFHQGQCFTDCTEHDGTCSTIENFAELVQSENKNQNCLNFLGGTCVYPTTTPETTTAAIQTTTKAASQVTSTMTTAATQTTTEIVHRISSTTIATTTTTTKMWKSKKYAAPYQPYQETNPPKPFYSYREAL